MRFSAASGKGIRFKKTPLEPGSNPVKAEPFWAIEQVEEQRRHMCARYQNCLDHAAGEKWTGWSCCECPVRERLSAHEQVDQLEGLAALLAEIAGPKSVRLRLSYFWKGR